MSSPAAKKKSVVTPCKTMRGHTKRVRGVAHLPGGQRIITCSGDGSLRLWDRESGAQIGDEWRDEGDEAEIRTMALSPNGKTIASGSQGGTVRLWNVETGKVVVKWKGHTKSVKSVCWSPNGERVVSGSYDGMARVWDVKSEEPVNGLNPIKTGREYVYAVSYSPKATMIATGGYNESGIKIWDAKTGKLLNKIKDNGVFSLAWTSDEKKLIAGLGVGYSIRIFDTATWQQIADLEGHTNVVYSITLFPNDRLLGSTSWDRTARIWNLDTNLPVGPPLQHEKDVERAAFSANGKLLSTACADQNAYAWNVQAILKTAGLEDLLSISDAQKSELKKKALPGAFFDDVQDPDPSSTTRRLHPDPSPHHRRSAFALSSGSHPRALLACLSQLFRRSQPKSDEPIALQQRPGPSASFRRSPPVVEVPALDDKKALYTAQRQERASDKARRIKNPKWWARVVLFLCLQLWNLDNGQPIGSPLQHAESVDHVSFSEDGKLLATGCRDKNAYTWDIAVIVKEAGLDDLLSDSKANKSAHHVDGTRSPVQGRPPAYQRTACKNLPGRSEVNSDLTKTPIVPRCLLVLEFWSMASPSTKTKETSAIKPRQKFEGHTEEIWGVIHLPDRQRIMTYSIDGSLRVWNLKSGKQIGEDWRDGESGVGSIALSPNGKKVVSGSEDGAVRLWDIGTCKVITKWTGHTQDVVSVCWSRDGRRVLSGSNDGTARQWDVEKGKTILELIETGHNQVWAVVYSPDMTLIATGGRDGPWTGAPESSVKIRDAKTGRLVATLKGHTDAVRCLAWDGKTLISGSYDCSIRTWDTTKWEQIAVLKEHASWVFAIVISPNGRILASSSLDHTARLWNLENSQPISSPLQHARQANCVSFSADGKLLATGCDDKNSYTWDVVAIVKEAGLDDLLLDSKADKSAIRANATQHPIQQRPPAYRQGFFDGVPPAHSSARSRPHQPGSMFLGRLFHRSPSDTHDISPSSPLDWARNLLKQRGQSDEGTEFRGGSPAVVDVPYAKGKRRNASAREVALAKQQQKQKQKQKQKTKPLRSKNPTAGSSRPLKPNVTSQPQAVVPSSSTTPDVGDATAAATSTPPSRRHATIKDAGLWARFWLFLSCLSPEYTDGDH
ncbi:WD40 repeat-like protein [Suillus weaverae]|nr:WD40 repeat-like protein [Suillus weaverae]